MKKKSKIWKRTIIYSSLMLIVYVIAVIYLVIEVGFPKSKNNILLSVSLEQSKSTSKLLKILESELRKKNVSNSIIADVLSPLRNQNNTKSSAIRQIKTLEKISKTGNNEKQIALQLKANYKILNKNGKYKNIYSEIESIHFKSIIIITLFLVAIALVIFILIKLIVSPLENIITEVHKIAEGNFDVKFKADTSDELEELAEVLNDLSANFKELLILMKSTYKDGFLLIDQLIEIKENKTVSGDEFSKLVDNLNNIFISLNEITVYFTSFNSKVEVEI